MLIQTAIRTFARAKQYYLTTVFTLAITLSMVLSVFSLVDLVFFAPLPYQDADNLYLLEGRVKLPTRDFEGTNPQVMTHIEKNNDVFVDVATYHRHSDYKLYDKTDRPEVQTILASSNLFALLGVKPVLGRLFNQAETLGNHQPSVVLGYRAWQGQYQGDKNIVGRKIQLNQRRFTVIGVAPDNLALPHYNDINQALWIPMDMDETFKPRSAEGIFGHFKGVARIKPGIVRAAVDQQLTQLTKQGAELYTREVLQDFALISRITVFRQALQGDSAGMVLMLLLGVLLLMVIALINLSSMQLARAVSKIKTVAIGFAFGASNRQLLIASFKHNALVVGLAVVLALLLTGASFSAVQILAADSIQRLDTLGISFNTLLVSLLLAAFVALLYSWLELRVVNEQNLTASLQSSGKGVGKQMSTGTSHLLIGFQVTFSFIVLLATCHVVFHTLSEALRDNGVSTENNWSLTVNYSQIEGKPARLNLHKSLTGQLAKLPGVTGVESVSEPQLPEGLNLSQVYDKQNQYVAQARNLRVSPGYLSALNMPLAGKGFAAGDSELDNYPLIINQRLADKIGADNTAVLGQKISLNGKTFHPVIGIVANTYVPGAIELEADEVYTPQQYRGEREYSFLITTADDISLAQSVPESVRELLVKVDSRLDISLLATLAGQFDDKRKRHLTAAWIAIILASASLLMVCIGINGIVNYMVQVRRYDMGVKLAMGADTKRLLKDSLIELMRPVAMSLVFAFSLSFMLLGYSKTQPTISFDPDWLMVATIFGGFCVLSLLVSYFPVRQILAQDPIKALRNE